MAQENKDDNGGIKKIQFCPYCGAKLSEDSQFCSRCGERIISNIEVNSAQARTESKAKITVPPLNTELKNESEEIAKEKADSQKRKIVYEGEIHKCPNCGEVLDAFVTKCPSCGYELRGSKSATSLQELSAKLEEISSRKMPENSGKQSGKIFVTGKAAQRQKEGEEQARKDFEEQKNNEKASLISNFAVPNTKEDILEFIIMAAANIDTKEFGLDTVSSAWLSKLEQAYQKAELTLANQPEFLQIKRIYDNKIRDVNISKLKGPLLFFGLIEFLCLGIGFGLISEGNGIEAIPCFIIGGVLIIVAVVVFIHVFGITRKSN